MLIILFANWRWWGLEKGGREGGGARKQNDPQNFHYCKHGDDMTIFALQA